jgi:hypothetical protein
MAKQGPPSGDILKGLTNDSASSSDASTKLPKSPSVNTPTRTDTASSPGTLGPRCA